MSLLPMSMRRVGSFAAFSAFSMSAAMALGIRIADNPASPNFTTLQAAVDAAQDGNLLLVTPGNYGPAIIDGKSLSIVAWPTGTPHIGPLTVRNLSSTQTLVVSGFRIEDTTGTAVTLENDAGDVRFQACDLRGGAANVSIGYYSFAGRPALAAHACAKVAIQGCQLSGGDAYVEEGGPDEVGGHALDAENSNIVLCDSTLHGGDGSAITNPGGDAGDACHVVGWGLFASGCTFTGGNGGRSDYLGCDPSGAGGDGIDATNAQLKLLDLVLQPGFGFNNVCGMPGPTGVQVRNVGGTVAQLQGTRRRVAAAALSPDGSLLSITVTGQPGDRLYLIHSPATAFQFQSAFNGVWLLPPPSMRAVRTLLPPSGVATVALPMPDITGTSHRLEVIQGFCLDTNNQLYLTSAVHVELLDAASAPDCDANGVNDLVQILTGTSFDTNWNLVPDVCAGG